MRNKWQPSVLLQWLLIRPLMEKAAAKYEILPLREFSQKITGGRWRGWWGSGRNNDWIWGAHVWIDSNATILPGITLGDWAVVAARAVVTQDIPPRKVAGGVPGKVLKVIPENK